jgi:alpha-ketoglutarate-dependent taurine dioxygenase
MTTTDESLGSGTPQRQAGLQRAAVKDRVGTVVGPLTILADARDRLAARTWSAFDADLLGTTLGAEVSGLDLAGPLDDATVAELRQALCAYKVLVFRDQDLDGAAQLAFAGRFGPLERHPFLAGSDDSPELVRLAKDATVGGYENAWHADVTWRAEPPMAAVLRAVEIPPVGGDTLWADMAAAYAGLDPDLRAVVDGRTAVHDFLMSFGGALSPEDLAVARERYPAVEHPVVRTHPETGEQVLFVNGFFTRHLVGLDEGESERVLDLLFRQASLPEYQVRLRWEVGTVAVWDNRSTQHYACSDYWPHARVMERAAIAGDRPV